MCSLNIRKTIYIFTIAVISMQLFGCGGGGGGGGSVAPTSLVYSGNTNSAVITLDNAPTLVGNVLYGGEAGTSIPVAATLTGQTTARSSGAVIQSEILQNISQHVHASIFKNNTSLMNIAVGVDLNEPLECDSGSGSLIGSLNNLTFTGTLTITYTNCLLDGTTYNGTGTFRIDAFDMNYIEITDATMAFTLLTISSAEFTGSMSGTIRIQSMIVSNTEKMTLNYVSKDSLTGKMYKFENIIITIVFDNYFSPNSMTETITGTPARAYDSIHGYVDVTTTTPMTYSSNLLTNPDIDGVMLFTGAAGASIRITVLSGKLVQLELDIDSIAGYEILRFLLWDELNVNAETNIADTDNDGMHDSWELTHGLDPTDESDINLDNDGDGFSNIEEYTYGANPNSNASIPPTADLSITITELADPVLGGTGIRYTLYAINDGPNIAKNLIIEDIIPAEAVFNNYIEGDGWECNHSNGTVTCATISQVVGTSTVADIFITAPLSTGIISNTATISSSLATLDVNIINNSATETTDILPPSANLGITVIDINDPIAVSDELIYEITVTNSGPSIVDDALVTNTLPTGITFNSITTSQGSCTGSRIISCNIGMLTPLSSVNIVINVSATQSGTPTNIAIVASAHQDINTSNNTAIETTIIGTSGSSIQSQIDAAIVGDTILVPPGMYIGELNFNGKDITLESTDGPQKTTIAVNEGVRTAVQIGPGGAIIGFTIANANNSAIKTNGQGSLIKGNVFTGNEGVIGTAGSAVFGNVSSPSIEQNIFLHNSCDNQHSAAVVTFFNASSPVIINNVFANNPCRGIVLSGSGGNTSKVINNTLFGNRVGVEVSRQVSQVTNIYRNNIIVQNSIGFNTESGTDTNNPTWENNLVFGNIVNYVGTADLTGMNSNISADPLFVDESTNDYHIISGSPAIDAGSELDAPTIDFDGVTRPIDGDINGTAETDIGAFEAL